MSLRFTVDGGTVYSFLFTSNFRAKLSRNYTIININIKPCDLEISVLSVKSVCYFSGTGLLLLLPDHEPGSDEEDKAQFRIGT